nr:hypothetical protein [Tanacetum cinerariifolium]
MIISELDSTQEFVDKIGELRAISGHILGGAGVQIPENNLDDLHSSREEDGTSKIIDPQDLLGSLLLADIDLIILGCGPLALVDDFNPIEDNIGLLETWLDEEAVLCFLMIDCSCSKGSVEDKILILKPPKKCARCGHPVNGPYCQGCTILREKLEEDLVKYFQNIQNISESSDGSTNVVNAPREPFVVKQNHGLNPPRIDECCCFDQTKTSQFPVVHPPPQETSIEILHDQENVLLLAWDRVSEIKDAFENKPYKPEDIQELFRKLLDDLQNIHEELAEFINSPGWNRPAIYDNDDDDVDYTIVITPVLSTKEPDNSLEEYNIAITPVLPTEEPDNSLSMGDEHLSTILETESDEVTKSSVEDLVPILSESEGIPDNICNVPFRDNSLPLDISKDQFDDFSDSNDDSTSIDDDSFSIDDIDYTFVSLEVEKIVIPEDEEIEDDNLREKLLKVNLLIAEIEALKDNPTPSSEFLTKSSSTSPKPFLEGTNTFHNSLLEFENFCFDLEEISSGSTTTHFHISLLEYEAFSFYDDHIEEISSDSTTTQSDFNDEEFGDESAHIISPPEYACFYFGNLPDPGELISSLYSRIRENLSSTTCVNLPVEDDHSPLLAYVVWIFLAYLTYPVIPPHLHTFRNEDTIFDPGITINRFYSFKPGLSHRCGTFKKFNTHRSHLNKSPMEMLFSTLFPMDQ